MTKLAFYAGNLTERGTAVALYDYAIHNRAMLGNESVVLYDRNFAGNNPKVIEKFQADFELIACDGFTEADSQIAAEGCDMLYVIKAGKRDGVLSQTVPTLVHAVFSAGVGHVHGAAYAYVSQWLADHCTGGRLPWVPHVVSIGEGDDDLRTEMGIPPEALVFGCYGGRDSFDIGFVKDEVIPEVLEREPQTYFIFMNIAKFIDHPRVIFRPATADIAAKTAFINSCDAMLHARRRGETFGLAVGEFSLRNKPVLTFAGSKERAHLDVLGESAQRYHTPQELIALLTGFDRAAPSAREAYRTHFSPEGVMQRFDAHLITPARAGDLDAAQKALGWQRWNPVLRARPKLRKLFRAVR